MDKAIGPIARTTLQKLAALAVMAASGVLLTTGALSANLTIGLNVTPTSMDPHFHYVTQNGSPLSHVLEPLVKMEGDRSLHPGLAVSWKAIDATTWEFKLRKGVKFHDGSDFTASDVTFTYKRVPLVPNSPSSFAIFLKSISETQVVDPHTLRFKTAAPNEPGHDPVAYRCSGTGARRQDDGSAQLG
jgi:peptide/nickel transport system substrate-binding protein